ncbi:MAG: ribosome assembly RNA-binding protein YhbY [Porticoccaceae bacterium]|jgi:RNA-binding protein|nr:MAG: RNA-binding protein [SAR92 bacterium BACL16 MAG-120619-bin48]KRP26758.1 MAG: RNA-binding protein [SAR92 bacterium BACL16 MAG-120322-bin99]MDO7634705.1 ribosome assembly RNA-binding protein YhbY [Porticoccaceae bacterium]MDP4655133.1 ribosome assembly RNA-binding protein YhbY [Alphaproteobacteria bacterium]MDP4745876.1 ribosome assembly RNA-binding protein YhbY [Porticoccaceae bacterium]
MTSSNEDKKHLRRLGHNLKPVVTVAGNGLSETVNAEIERALTDHELIKVKLVADDRDSKKALTEAICADHKAELVQSVGHVLLLFRKSKTPDPRLSNLLR